MKTNFITLLSFVFVSWMHTSNDRNKQVSEFMNIFRRWDTVTVNSLKDYSSSHSKFAGKANLIRSSLEGDSQSIDFLNRKEFLTKLATNSFNFKRNKINELIIVELNISGEKNSFKKI